MERSTIRLTMAQALVRWLTAQWTEIDGQKVPLFGGVFAIFGHGNVTCLSKRWRACRASFRHGADRTSNRWRLPPSAMRRPSDAGRS